MNCPKCNNPMSFFKENNSWFCRVCNEWHGSIEVKVALSSWDTKGISASLGVASSIIVLFIIYVYSEILFFWPWIGYFMIFWGAILPIVGSILVFADKLKIGGYLQIFGSVLFFPIGYIGIHGGLIALKLANLDNNKGGKKYVRT